MQENIGIADAKADGYEVIVTNITWDKKNTYSKYASKKDFSKTLPDQFTFNLPDSIAAKANEPGFEDIVETFTYNLLAHRFNHIACHCQIWLPLAEEAAA